MTEVTELEFEKNFDNYMERIENQKEEFLIRRADGTAVVAVPAGEEYNYLWDHDDASWKIY